MKLLKMDGLEQIVTDVGCNTWSKEKNKYTPDEKMVAYGNPKALYAIFSGVNIEQFDVISICEPARDAWIILQT